jgi:hypothetical protein
VTAQLTVPPREWPAAVRDLVTSVTAADFELVDLTGGHRPPRGLKLGNPEPGIPAHDLIAMARLAP